MAWCLYESSKQTLLGPPLPLEANFTTDGNGSVLDPKATATRPASCARYPKRPFLINRRTDGTLLLLESELTVSIHGRSIIIQGQGLIRLRHQCSGIWDVPWCIFVDLELLPEVIHALLNDVRIRRDILLDRVVHCNVELGKGRAVPSLLLAVPDDSVTTKQTPKIKSESNIKSLVKSCQTKSNHVIKYDNL